MYRTATFPDIPFAAAAPAMEPALASPPARRWLQWASIAFSLAIIAVLMVQLRTVSVRHLRELLPVTATFWLVYVTYYFAPVAFEWVIFRKLWKIPPSGFAALTRKYVGNEMLLGYIGEVYFYVWARQRSKMVGAPFGAIKDVAILSAIVGNAVTLALMVAAYPLLGELQLGLGGREFYISTAVILLFSLGALLVRRRLFSLPGRQLRMVAIVHLVRILAMTGLAALMWHLILPSVSTGWWLLLASLRLLLSRLPFVPNKDAAFAGLAILAIGHDTDIIAMLAMMGALLAATHIVVGGLVAAPDLFRSKESRC